MLKTESPYFKVTKQRPTQPVEDNTELWSKLRLIDTKL